MSDSTFDEQSRLLKPLAFEFALDGELRRAVRSQNYLTLVTVETSREFDGMTVAADQGTVGEVAQIIRTAVRDTDVLGVTNQGLLSLVLLDADYANSSHVIDRVMERMNHYDFPSPLRLSVGAACYPTDAVDAASLQRQAISHPVISWRGGQS